VISGGDGHDILFGQEDADQIRADPGDDTVIAGNGLDRVWGDLGNDYLEGGLDADVLQGEIGDDVLSGGRGDDEVYGGPGTDVLIDGYEEGHNSVTPSGSDLYRGGDGRDIVIYDGARDDYEIVYQYSQIWVFPGPVLQPTGLPEAVLVRNTATGQVDELQDVQEIWFGSIPFDADEFHVVGGLVHASGYIVEGLADWEKHTVNTSGFLDWS